MMVNTRVLLLTCVLLSMDVINCCENNIGHPRKLSSGDEGYLFTSKRIQDRREQLDHIDLNLSSAPKGLLKKVFFSC